MTTFVDLSGCIVAVDTMLNAANIAYGAVPIRLYIVQNSKIAYEGGPGPLKYRMREVKTWLDQAKWTARNTLYLKCCERLAAEKTEDPS